MTSKISYFKIAMDDLRHRMWMPALSCLGSLLALPVFFLLYNSGCIESYEWNLQYYSLQAASDSLTRDYGNFLMAFSRVSCGMILFVGALIVGIFGYRYLYSRKMVDLYHSIPIKREKLFLIYYVDGFLIWLIPLLISQMITLILLLINMSRYGIAHHFGRMLTISCENLFLFTLAFLTIYNFSLVCVMLCGNAFNTICMTGLGGTLVAALWGLNWGYSELYLRSFVAPAFSIRQISFASPLVNAILLLLETDTDDKKLFAGEGWFLCSSILMILACFLGALLLYLRRPSELAEHGVDAPIPQHVIRVGTSIAAGLSLGAIFILLLTHEAYGWILFGIILGSVFVFGVVNVIFHMDFRSFFKNKLELLLTVVATCLLLALYHFDLTGYNTRLPKQSDIVSANLTISGLGDENLYYYRGYDALDPYENMKDNRFITYEDNTALYSLLEQISSKEHLAQADDYYYESECIVYLKRKNGTVFTRRYDLQQEDMEALRPLVETDAYREAHYPVSSGLSHELPSEIELRPSASESSITIRNKEQIEDIMTAYAKDFKAHYSLDRLLSDITVCCLAAEYEDSDYGNYHYLEVSEQYTETIAAILKYYPDCPIIADNLKITGLTLEPDVDGEMPREYLYSYFGLPGYPSYEKLSSEFFERQYEEQPDSFYYTDAVEKSYLLQVENPDDIARLSGILHVGNLQSNHYGYLYDHYVLVGYAELENGSRVGCYADAGAFPKEWIDRLELVVDDDSDDSYDEYYY